MNNNSNVLSEKHKNDNFNIEKVPKLRFPEFDEDWSESKIDNLFNFSVAGDMKKELFNKYKTQDFQYPLFANALEEEGLLGYYKEYKYNPNSITITARGVNIGHATVRNERFSAIGRLIILTQKQDMNMNFFKEYINNNVKIHVESTGVPQLTAPSLKINKVKFPSIEEQNKIANFLLLIDKKIELLEKKHKSTEKIKKSLIELLIKKTIYFNKDSEWNEVELSEILFERKELRYKDGKYPHVTLSKEGISPKTEMYNREFLVKDKNKKYKVTHFNDICYNPANLKFGVISINKLGSAIFSPIYVTFEVRNANVDFIAYSLIRNNFINKIRKYEEGTVYERMAVKPFDFLKETIFLPPLEEQIKIAEILNNLDESIRNSSKQITLMKNFKKGLLQQMFV